MMTHKAFKLLEIGAVTIFCLFGCSKKTSNDAYSTSLDQARAKYQSLIPTEFNNCSNEMALTLKEFRESVDRGELKYFEADGGSSADLKKLDTLNCSINRQNINKNLSGHHILGVYCRNANTLVINKSHVTGSAKEEVIVHEYTHFKNAFIFQRELDQHPMAFLEKIKTLQSTPGPEVLKQIAENIIYGFWDEANAYYADRCYGAHGASGKDYVINSLQPYFSQISAFEPGDPEILFFAMIDSDSFTTFKRNPLILEMAERVSKK